MDAQEIEHTPAWESAVLYEDAAGVFTGPFDSASEAWAELLDDRIKAEEAADPSAVISEHLAHMSCIVGVLDLLESGGPTFRVTWRNLLHAEFGLNEDGSGELRCPDPSGGAALLTYRVTVHP